MDNCIGVMTRWDEGWGCIKKELLFHRLAQKKLGRLITRQKMSIMYLAYKDYAKQIREESSRLDILCL